MIELITPTTINQIMLGQNFEYPGHFTATWATRTRLYVSCRYGGFTRTVVESTAPSVRSHLERIVASFNANAEKLNAEETQTPTG